MARTWNEQRMSTAHRAMAAMVVIVPGPGLKPRTLAVYTTTPLQF